MFDKELMKQLATIPAENRAEWFAERDKLRALAAEMDRLNADEMVMKYGVARVIRVLAATIKCCPEEYDFSQRVGTYTGDGDQGEAGDLVVTEPVEGQVYGYGQKDYRGNNTEKKFAKWTGEKFVPCDKIGRAKEG